MTYAVPLWQAELETRPYDWLLHGDTLFVTANGGERPLLAADRTGWRLWHSDVGGRLVADGENVLRYNGDGLYRLDLQTESVEPLFTLSGGRRDAGDVVPLPGCGLLIAHVDRADRRLVAFDASGNLLWDHAARQRPCPDQHRRPQPDPAGHRGGNQQPTNND